MHKRVLFVEGNVDGTIGGSYFSLLYLLQGLDKARYQPVVVFCSEHALIPKYAEAGAQVIIRSPAPPAKPSAWPLGRLFSKAVNFLIGSILESARIVLLLKRQRVSMVHLNNAIVRNHPWMIAARICRLPCLTHERGINSSYSGRSRFLGRGLAAVICISSAVRENLERNGVRGLRLVTIPNGLDPRQMAGVLSREAVLAEFNLPGNTRLIGIVGNLKEWKGQEVVIRAMSHVRRDFDNVVCLLIGDFSVHETTYREKVLGLIEQLDLADKVVITGYRANVADYVANLEFLLHASIEPEPFGRVLLEGMALRKAIVGSRGGAVPEIVDDGRTGLLHEPGDVMSLTACITKLLAAPSMSRELGEAGYQRLVAQFSIDSNVLATQKLYDQILSSRLPARDASTP
jgi:glycosyltransferase involved in cell wall biosynthesis